VGQVGLVDCPKPATGRCFAGSVCQKAIRGLRFDVGLYPFCLMFLREDKSVRSSRTPYIFPLTEALWQGRLTIRIDGHEWRYQGSRITYT